MNNLRMFLFATIAVMPFFAWSLVIDQGAAMVITGILVAASSLWNTFKISQVHTLVNSNFTEAKLARLAAEDALKKAQDLNIVLQEKLISIENKKEKEVRKGDKE